MREEVAINHQQRATQDRGLANSRSTASRCGPIAGPMGRSLCRHRRRGTSRLAARMRGALAVWRVPKFHPYGRMITGAIHSPYLTIDTGILQALDHRGTQQNVVETQTAIAFPTVPQVLPKRVHQFIGNGACEWRRSNPAKKRPDTQRGSQVAGRRDPRTSSGRCRGLSARRCNLPSARRALQSRRVQRHARSSALAKRA